ncbi:MAG: serine/threonine-protein kinase [Polyangiaceae bacterium]
MTQAALRADDLPRLEKYEVLEEIGHGGMATVYRARDLRLEREVAVKLIHRHLRENREVATRFVAEARAAAKLKHPNIVEVYDVSGEDDRERYLVVELVNGKTLRDLLVAHREMPAEIGAAIVSELCDAIDHAHHAGIIHRDIKPENVLVSIPEPAAPASEVSADRLSPVSITPPVSNSGGPSSKNRSRALVLKITDFGIAKILDSQGVTSTGQVLGSPAHMAPEQVDGGDVDARTDVFALGVLLYECMVGHLPFEGKNPAQVLRRVIEGRYERAETERPTVGGRFSAILDQALATNAADRLESPAALAKLLRDELAVAGITSPREEIVAFFHDPAGYTARLHERLVDVLVARGEAARKNKQVGQAALDFNRAHALRPDDLTIIKRMGQVASRRQGSRVMTRAAGVIGASLLLGAGAFGVVRVLRNPSPKALPAGALDAASTRPSVESEPTPVRTSPALVATASTRTSEPSTAGEMWSLAPIAPSVSGSVSAALSVSASASARVTATSSDVAPAPADRPVLFVVLPRSATLVVEGRIIDHASASSITFSVGHHTGTITPAPGDKSCQPGSQAIAFDVDAAKPGETKAQVIPVSATFLPARVNVMAPSGGQVVCGNLTLKQGQNEVPMKTPEASMKCRFVLSGEPDKTGEVKLVAGDATTAAWPAQN